MVTRDEYQLHSQRGNRIVMAFDNRERALAEGQKRNLRVYHVTTTQEELRYAGD